ncbi:hypothetical protein GXM_05631 [Nostoc sphaeroides CCNUC1]|uniref:Uncharacterized protein n=1 Tax=Nostoc sphaeroides CCNUC1 TaxID=2653204 RepID=A0A5P8W860_9NOSO|nr:hypothetical protein GXM_05631 [Nostoc sphaeroides CCNUC1]
MPTAVNVSVFKLVAAEDQKGYAYVADGLRELQKINYSTFKSLTVDC